MISPPIGSSVEDTTPCACHKAIRTMIYIDISPNVTGNLTSDNSLLESQSIILRAVSSVNVCSVHCIVVSSAFCSIT